MIKLGKSDILKKVLKSLIQITSKKTSKSHAYLTVNLLVCNLEKEYEFLKHVNISTKKQGQIFSINQKIIYDLDVYPEINHVPKSQIGEVIQKLIDNLQENLGKKAGYFFIRKFRDTLGKDYHFAIKEMGVDLRLNELQKELYGWSPENYQIKDDGNSNSSYIEKK